jgi:heme-degrading monooxygenase HmoA
MSPTLTSISSIAVTPRPPYYAVIFTSIRTDEQPEAYGATADRMMQLAAASDGFLGVESVREYPNSYNSGSCSTPTPATSSPATTNLGITVSYWRDLNSIRAWKQHSEHRIAQERGQTGWYSAYTTRISKVERDYSM